MTGGTGFVGRAVVRALAGRGDDVVVPARDRARAAALVELGATIVDDDLSEVDQLTETLRDADAVVHAAGSYRVGIGKDERGAMWDAHIGSTTRLLDAAEAARTPRIVYVSTVGVFGNTRGAIVDEGYRRDLREGFFSWYDQTKYGAHEVAEQRSRAGTPVIIVLPSQVYGPGDQSLVGDQLRRAYEGRLSYRMLDEVGFGFVHVDDLAAGIVAALDRGQLGRRYILSGEQMRVRDALAVAARLGGRQLPPIRIPSALMAIAAPVVDLFGRTNLREIVASGAGVTYWGSFERAAAELGFAPRTLEDGLRDTFIGPTEP